MRLLFLLMIFTTMGLYNIHGQTATETLKNTDLHEHSKNEIGIAISPV